MTEESTHEYEVPVTLTCVVRAATTRDAEMWAGSMGHYWMETASEGFGDRFVAGLTIGAAVPVAEHAVYDYLPAVPPGVPALVVIGPPDSEPF